MSKQAVKVVFDLYVDTAGPVAPASFHRRATGLMDALMDLDACNDDIADPTVSSDAGESVMNVEILVFTGEPIAALEKASAVLRTALHAAGAATAAWPIAHMTHHTGTVTHLADA
ncbi:hypothetical protein ACFQZ2_14490 [Streptomonospora algeriensis]|uniref:Uncharacterized protein n=1 Tax=Streptomonospora algeriensis TaxID=995084 RepID=A0ABW3BH32_9ACTN